MADISTFVDRTVLGNKSVTWGTYTDAGAGAGGDIDTRLHRCEVMILQPKGNAVSTNAPVVNETLPVLGSAVTIVCDAAQEGYWLAIGDAFA